MKRNSRMVVFMVLALCALTACSSDSTSGDSTPSDSTSGDTSTAASNDSTNTSSNDPDAPINSTEGTLLTDGTHNILFIIADDLGVDNVSGYGEHDESASTPNIDSLASSGVMFRNAWVNPMCSPSRASLYTGRHAYHHGVLHPAGAELDTEEETFAEVLQAAGYRTALFGKWHLGSSDGTTPIDQGFNYFAGAEGNIDDYFNWTKLTMGGRDNLDSEETSTQYATAVNVSDAKSWIGQVSAQDNPWMAVIAFNAPHSPYHVPPSSLYSSVTLNGEAGDECDGTTDSQSDCYHAAAEAMDNKLGELITFLDTQGELDNTLVVVIGDNGTPGNVIIDDGVFDGSHGKTTVYEGGVNVPFIVYGPNIGIEQGLEETELVMGLDVFTTFIEVAGAEATSGNTIDSQSLLEHITGGDTSDARTVLYTELFRTEDDIDRWAITNGNAKYIYNDGVEECYNLNRDPGESSEKYADDAPITGTCDTLKTQRPCIDTSECPE
ncbi:MAG: sulfatase-like hydrolase/transferase [Myxococcota bacterium]